MPDELLLALGAEQRAADGSSEGADLLTPPSADERLAILDGAFGRLEQPSPATDSEVVPLDRARAASGRARTWVAVLVAVAAAVALWVVLRPSPSADGAQVQYALSSVRAGRAEVRAEPIDTAKPIRTTSSDRFEAVLTPQRTNLRPVALALVARSDERDAVVVARPTAGVTFSPEGAVWIAAPLDSLISLSEGSWTLELWVGSPESLPASDAPLATSQPSLAVGSLRLEVVPTP